MLKKIKALYWDSSEWLLPLLGKLYEKLYEETRNTDFLVASKMLQDPAYLKFARDGFMKFHHLPTKLSHLKENWEYFKEAYNYGKNYRVEIPFIAISGLDGLIASLNRAQA